MLFNPNTILTAAQLNALVESPQFKTRLDLSAVNFSASFRDDGSGNLGWYIGAAGAADGAQVKVATVDKATGNVGFGTASVLDALHVDRPAAPTGLTKFGLRATTGGQYGARFLGYLDNGVSSGAMVETISAGVAIERARVNHLGNWGFGTTAPHGKMSFGTSIGLSGLLVYDDGTAASGFGITPNTLNIYSGGSIVDIGVGYTLSGGYTPTIRVIPNAFYPVADNAAVCGGPSNRWSVIYAGTGTINTSDAREKVTPDGEAITEETGWSVTPPTEAELRVARRLHAALGFFKFKDAVAAKGLETARRHFGLTVQFALQVCEEEGVDPWSIGIFCRDEITRKVKVMRTVTEQKTEPDPEFDIVIEVVDGVPTQVRKARQPKPVFEMKPVIGLDGEIVMQTVIVEGESGFPVERQEPVLHPVPVMIEVTRDVEVEEPAGERLGFRPDQLTLFMLRGMLPTTSSSENN